MVSDFLCRRLGLLLELHRVVMEHPLHVLDRCQVVGGGRRGCCEGPCWLCVVISVIMCWSCSMVGACGAADNPWTGKGLEEDEAKASDLRYASFSVIRLRVLSVEVKVLSLTIWVL